MTESSPQLADPEMPHAGPVLEPPIGRKRRRLIVATVAMLVVVGVLLVNAALVDGQSDPASGRGLVHVDGVSMYVRQDGPPDAPALVLIHGLAGSTAWWDAVVPMLAASHRVIRIDLLGHGRSDKPAGAGYSIPDQARRVGLILDRIGVRHAIVIGHSTGGYVATELAGQRPDLVTALTLIDTGPSMDAFISDGPVGNLLFTPVVGQLLWRARTDSIIRKGLSTAFSRRGYRIPQEFVDDVRGMTYHSLTSASSASDDYLRQRALPTRLTAIDRPLLVIFGQDDHRWRSSMSVAEYRELPGAQVEVVPGVGHSPMLEAPQRTADLVLAFAAGQQDHR
jgi:pimeloyl-ACP methyl ester carboxylesterase